MAIRGGRSGRGRAGGMGAVVRGAVLDGIIVVIPAYYWLGHTNYGVLPRVITGDYGIRTGGFSPRGIAHSAWNTHTHIYYSFNIIFYIPSALHCCNKTIICFFSHPTPNPHPAPGASGARLIPQPPRSRSPPPVAWPRRHTTSSDARSPPDLCSQGDPRGICELLTRTGKQ